MWPYIKNVIYKCKFIKFVVSVGLNLQSLIILSYNQEIIKLISMLIKQAGSRELQKSLDKNGHEIQDRCSTNGFWVFFHEIILYCL